MKKQYIVPGIVLVVLAVAALIVHHFYFDEDSKSSGFSAQNATYIIDGHPVALVNGSSTEDAAPGSATKIVTRIFGTPIFGDLNGDGTLDAAVLIEQNPGGSGTFYYVAAALNNGNRAIGTNAILLGDRVAPQNVEVSQGMIIANYADRLPGEPMTAQPSQGVSKYLKVQGTSLIETAQPQTSR